MYTAPGRPRDTKQFVNEVFVLLAIDALATSAGQIRTTINASISTIWLDVMLVTRREKCTTLCGHNSHHRRLSCPGFVVVTCQVNQISCDLLSRYW